MNSGLWAALGAALCWTVSATAFTEAGRRIGSIPLNLLRLMVAGLILCSVLLLCPEASSGRLRDPSNWMWFGISGFLGFFLADLCLFRAFLDIGPRRTLLALSLAPPVSSLIGAVWLGERLMSLQWLGMAVTLGGVMWGVLEADRREVPPTGAGAHRMRGLSLAGMGMLMQSLSVVVSKRGIAGTVTPVEATLIRVCAGLAGFAVLIALTGRIGRVRAGARNGAAMAQLSLGAAVGPVLGVVLMMRALQQVPSGIAQTVLATTPVLIIPLSAILHQERITPARVCASLLALAGVALLFLA